MKSPLLKRSVIYILEKEVYCRDRWGTYQVVDGEGHDEGGEEKVSHRQGHYEVVGDGLQRTFLVYGHEHQNVAEHGEDWEQQQQQSPVVLLRVDGVVIPGAVHGAVLFNDVRLINGAIIILETHVDHVDDEGRDSRGGSDGGQFIIPVHYTTVVLCLHGIILFVDHVGHLEHGKCLS